MELNNPQSLTPNVGKLSSDVSQSTFNVQRSTFKIVAKKQFSDKVFLFEVEAPLIAKSRKAGNFVIVRVGNKGERMPLTIADADVERGTISLVVQEVGLSSTKLCNLNVGDSITDVVGPLGNPTHIEKFGTVVCAGGGVGVAPMLPIIRALKAAGNRVLSVMAGRSKDLIIMEDEVRKSSDEIIIMTDDGSYGEKGVVTVGIEKFIKQEHIDKVFAIGPPIMMKFCCLLTQKYGISTDVSLNTIMVDGTGMCGACRLTIGGKTKFVCIDGPEFDGALVDWDEMFKRMGTFKTAERDEMEHYQEHIDTLNAENSKNDSSKSNAKPSNYDDKQIATNDPISELTDKNASWRQALRASMKPKERREIERVAMPELDPVYRATTRTEEVNIGLTKEMALLEAKRCLDCGKPTCVEGCPVNVNIPSFIKNIERGEFLAAAKVLKDTSALPAVCGRVCPQEKQCESLCIHLKMGEKAVAIGYLERFAADYERESGNVSLPQIAPSNGIKVAVVGSGPSGLSFAGDMVKKGYDVYVFEALHEIGGVLKYGIPEFRLPNRIVDVEIENLKKMGVHFVTDCIVGKTISVDELEDKGFKGIFVGSGAGLPNFMGIPGENAINIMSSNEYLTRVNLMDAANPATDTPINIGKKVIVVGGGNTAMDSCRTAKRLGGDVTLVYRRSEAEMPARLEEVKHAKEEGIKFLTLHNPIEYLTDERGAVRAAVLQQMQLGEPDASGRRRPEPIPGAIKTIDVDQVIVAVGVSPNPLVPKSIRGLELGRKSTIVVNDEMQSSRPDIFAGGDIVRGGATVILAMGDGRRAAANMDNKLSQKVEK
jgi:glutamate synthase (NADPH/NADH) small chain